MRITQMHLLFKKYVMKTNFGTQSMHDYDDSKRVLFGDGDQQAISQIMEEQDPAEVDDDFFGDDLKRSRGSDDDLEKKKDGVFSVQDWKNGVLVLISVRLGLKKVPPEYFPAVRSFFMQILNVGIIGGRPREAYFLVGMQEESLIFLDPHNTLEAVPCDKRTIEKMHLKFHEGIAKKIHFTKIDPSMTFGFYLKDHNDYAKFEKFMLQNKRMFGEHWIFSHMDTKPDYLKPEAVHEKRKQENDPILKPSVVGSYEEFDILTSADKEKEMAGERQKQAQQAAEEEDDDGFDIL